ncbi:MAG: ATP-binding protein [Paracoccaceae bacterium]
MTWPILLIVTAALALGLVILRLTGLGGLPGARLRRFRRQLEGRSHPLLLTRFSGEVLYANAAMADLAGPYPSLAGAAAAIDPRIDASALFRLARAAREHGMAVEPIRPATAHPAETAPAATIAPEAHGQSLVAVTHLPGDELLWSFPPLAAAVDAIRIDPDPYRAAPFAYALCGRERPPAGNLAFERLFDPADPALVDRFAGFRTSWGGRCRLVTRGGATAEFRIFGRDRPDVAGFEVFAFEARADTDLRDRPTRILDLVPVPLAQFESDGTLLWTNRLAREILGREATPGTPLSQLIQPLGRSAETLLVDAQTDGAGRVRGEMAQLRSDDKFVQIALTEVEIYGRPTLLAVLTDASELRQLEDQFVQSQKMEAVGKLAGGVAHDFNNVLTAILGHCDLLLLRKEVSHPDYSDLMQIAQNANRAAALVRQLLAFSRKQTLNPTRLSIRDVVSETHYLLSRLVGETIRLELNYGVELWDVRADHQQLEQVLMNLVVNARDAMEGSGVVRISIHNSTFGDRTEVGATELPAGDYVEMRVTDTGPGIDPSVIDKVFDPFFTTKSKGEGTGLGLSTVYGIVKQSGGFIFAENHAEGGASFRILLPRAAGEAPAVALRAPEPEAASRRDLSGQGSVLLVEDEDPVRAFGARALRLRGYDVAEAATAEDAMEILGDPDFRVDLIVSDVVMPGMDGPTFAVEARKLRPGVRLIFVSGYAEESFRKNLTDNEFLFLAKPFSLNELTAKVKEAIDTAPSP